MFVFVRNAGSPRLEVFGPATPSECRAWMRLKGLHPGQVVFDFGHQITSPGDNSTPTGWKPVPGSRNGSNGLGGVLPFSSSSDESDESSDSWV